MLYLDMAVKESTSVRTDRLRNWEVAASSVALVCSLMHQSGGGGGTLGALMEAVFFIGSERAEALGPRANQKLVYRGDIRLHPLGFPISHPWQGR